jgi:hypothetical protein
MQEILSVLEEQYENLVGKPLNTVVAKSSELLRRQTARNRALGFFHNLYFLSSVENGDLQQDTSKSPHHASSRGGIGSVV